MCTFPLLDVFVSFVPYLFISLPSMLFRRLGNCFSFHFLLGIFALKVLWLTDVTIIVIKGTVFSKNQKVSWSSSYRLVSL